MYAQISTIENNTKTRKAYCYRCLERESMHNWGANDTDPLWLNGKPWLAEDIDNFFDRFLADETSKSEEMPWAVYERNHRMLTNY